MAKYDVHDVMDNGSGRFAGRAQQIFNQHEMGERLEIGRGKRQIEC